MSSFFLIFVLILYPAVKYGTRGQWPYRPACDKGMLFWPQKASTELVLNLLTHSSDQVLSSGYGLQMASEVEYNFNKLNRGGEMDSDDLNY